MFSIFKLKLFLSCRRKVHEPGVEDSVFRELKIQSATHARESLDDSDDDNGDSNGWSDVTRNPEAPAAAADRPVLASRLGGEIAVRGMPVSRQQGFGRGLKSGGADSSGGSGVGGAIGGTRGSIHGVLAPGAARPPGVALASSAALSTADLSTGSRSSFTIGTIMTVTSAGQTKDSLSPSSGRRAVEPPAAATSGVAAGGAQEAGAVAARGQAVRAVAPTMDSSGIGFDILCDELPPAAGGRGLGGGALTATFTALGFPVFEDISSGSDGGVGVRCDALISPGLGRPDFKGAGSKIVNDNFPASSSFCAPPYSDLGFPVFRDGGGGEGSVARAGASVGADIKADGAGGRSFSSSVSADSRAVSSSIVPASPFFTSGLGLAVCPNAVGGDDGGLGAPFAFTSESGLGAPVFRDSGGSDIDGCFSSQSAVVANAVKGAESSSSCLHVIVDAPLSEALIVSGPTGTASSVLTKHARDEISFSSSLPDGGLSSSPPFLQSEEAAEGLRKCENPFFRSILEDSLGWEVLAADVRAGAGAATGNLSVYNMCDDSPELQGQQPDFTYGNRADSEDTDIGRSSLDAVPDTATVGGGEGLGAAQGPPPISTAASLSSSLRKKIVAGLHASDGGGMGLSRIPEGGTHRNPEGGSGDSVGGGGSGSDEDGRNNNFDTSCLLFEENEGVDAAGYSATRAVWLRPRIPGAAVAVTSKNTGGGGVSSESPRASVPVAPATPLGRDSTRHNGGGGFSRVGRRCSSLFVAEFGESLNSRQSLGSSWGGCSTIKRRGEDLTVGGPWTGWDVGNRLGVLGDGCSGGSGGLGENVMKRLAVRQEDDAPDVVLMSADDAGSNTRGGRQGDDNDGDMGRGSVECRLGLISRGSSGRGRRKMGTSSGGGGGVENVESGGATGSSGSGSGGRVDYHSLCFSSSSSSGADMTPHSSSALSASPFRLLDGVDDSDPFEM